MVPSTHPFRILLAELVDSHFNEIQLRTQPVKDYVTSITTDFCSCEELFKIRDADDHRITDLGKLLIEADPVYGNAPSFDREREVRKHIGDYTLFLLGMFPESINESRLRRERVSDFVDFAKAGRESYHIVSTFEYGEYRATSPLFLQLAKNFELCVHGLNLVKNDLRGMEYALTTHRGNLIV